MSNEISGVAAITALCFLLEQVLKASPLRRKWIPVLCSVFGVFLGILGYFTVTGFPASDPISAAAVGAVSGFAATGVNQAVHEFQDCGEKGGR